MGLKQNVLSIFIGYQALWKACALGIDEIYREGDVKPEERAAIEDHIAAMDEVREWLHRQTLDVIQAALAQVEIEDAMAAVFGETGLQKELPDRLKALGNALSALYHSGEIGVVSAPDWDAVCAILNDWDDNLTVFMGGGAQRNGQNK